MGYDDAIAEEQQRLWICHSRRGGMPGFSIIGDREIKEFECGHVRTRRAVMMVFSSDGVCTRELWRPIGELALLFSCHNNGDIYLSIISFSHPHLEQALVLLFGFLLSDFLFVFGMMKTCLAMVTEKRTAASSWWCLLADCCWCYWRWSPLFNSPCVIGSFYSHYHPRSRETRKALEKLNVNKRWGSVIFSTGASKWALLWGDCTRTFVHTCTENLDETQVTHRSKQSLFEWNCNLIQGDKICHLLRYDRLIRCKTWE